MERREFPSVTGAALVLCTDAVRRPPARRPISPSRSKHRFSAPTVFSQRISRAQDELKSRKLDLLVIEPSTNFQYWSPATTRDADERLIPAGWIPASGTPALVCPSFEVERIKRNTVIGDAARFGRKQEDPWLLVRRPPCK